MSSTFISNGLCQQALTHSFHSIKQYSLRQINAWVGTTKQVVIMCGQIPDIPLLLNASGAVNGITTISCSNFTCLSIPLMTSRVILGWKINTLITTHLPWLQLTISWDCVRMMTLLCSVIVKKSLLTEEFVVWVSSWPLSVSTATSSVEQSTSSDMLLMSSDKLSWQPPLLVIECLSITILNQWMLPKYCTWTCWPLLTTLPSGIWW